MMTEYINKESILDKIGSLPLNWEYGQAVDDIYKMVEAEPTVQIGCCEDCRRSTFDLDYGKTWCNLTLGCREVKPDGFCNEFKPKGD